jgi:hypothetical protein
MSDDYISDFRFLISESYVLYRRSMQYRRSMLRLYKASILPILRVGYNPCFPNSQFSIPCSLTAGYKETC